MTDCDDFFQYLCALAGTEELTEDERAGLREHLGDCAPCRKRLSETTAITSQLVFAQSLSERTVRPTEAVQERFIARAIAAGIPLSQPAARISRATMAGALMAALLIVAAVVNQMTPPRMKSQTSVTRHPRIERAEETAIPALAATAVCPPRSEKNRGRFRKAKAKLSPLPAPDIFDYRDYSIRLVAPGLTPLKTRFGTPPSLKQSNALNLLANFQPEEFAPGSRTFEFRSSPASGFPAFRGFVSR